MQSLTLDFLSALRYGGLQMATLRALVVVHSRLIHEAPADKPDAAS